ncbi:MAG TPA: hypothetical protein VNJ02_00500, partial [Vicinamibacterales bacterium]|nr:hypothetical protein [Vicinamibacterales bacterium]
VGPPHVAGLERLGVEQGPDDAAARHQPQGILRARDHVVVRLFGRVLGRTTSSYALRRLGREVEWVRYANGGHRPPNSVSETIDFEHRILAWYDKYLKADRRTPPTQQ